MNHSREIKDSDDEDDSIAGDPPPHPEQSYQPEENLPRIDGHPHDVNTNHSQSSDLGVNFDEFIQYSNESRPPSLSQQQKEGSWVPAEGGGSIGKTG